MTHILSLGANNKQTREYVYPKIANKKDEYICPDCNKDLILCQGKIIRPYFRHKVDSVNPCHHYSNPTETQIHKDGKMVMKSLLERKTPISFIRNCCSCKKNEEHEIPEMTESSKIELEYRFEYNGTKIADVAYIDNGDIFCIFEICNTHKTCSENRPEPWFEIDAETLIKLANDSSSQIKIPCIRCEKCDSCIENEKMYINIQREIKLFRTDVSLANKLNGRGTDCNYRNKHKHCWGYTGDLLEYVFNCDMVLSETITSFENKIYLAYELDKKIFEECYYKKYYCTLQKIRKYGGTGGWEGWGGKSFIVDGCYKPTMYKFIKHYNLINPITLMENLKIKFSM